MTYTVRHNVRVSLERALRVTVLGLVAGEVPDDQRLVATGGEQHVGARNRSVLESGSAENQLYRSHRSNVLLHGGSQAGDPAIL